jgi:hypothetical protein
MLGLRNEIHKQIVGLLKYATENNYPVYNTDTLVETPIETTRIEYSIGGAYSTGDMYRTERNVHGVYSEVTISEYGSDLNITVIGKPEMVDDTLYKIAGIFQSTGALEQYGLDFALLNETMVVVKAPVVKAGVIYNVGKIRVDIVYESEYTTKIDYFTDVDYELKTREEN